jgi:hypothetical protein
LVIVVVEYVILEFDVNDVEGVVDVMDVEGVEMGRTHSVEE